MKIEVECPECNNKLILGSKDVLKLNTKDKKHIKERKIILTNMANEKEKSFFGKESYKYFPSWRRFLLNSTKVYGKCKCVICKCEFWLHKKTSEVNK